MCKTNYEKLLNDTRNAKAADLKKAIFNHNETFTSYVKSLELDKEVQTKLLLMIQDRTFIDFLLINAFVLN